MNIQQYYEYVYPLYLFKKLNPDEKKAPLCIVGSSFYIGNNQYITCKHVVDNIDFSDFDLIIGYCNQNKNQDNSVRHYWVKNIEYHPKYDVAIFKTEITDKNLDSLKPPKAFKVSKDNLNVFDDIHTFGYPLAYEENHTTARGFKGHIVRYSPHLNRQLGQCIELSFTCPKGLSGAPLVCTHTQQVRGIIIGNTNKEMELRREIDTESTENSYKEIVVIETLPLGIALDIHEILDWEPETLGKSIKNHLIENDLF